jgi:histidinol-phosphate aminotransferase
MNSPVHPPRLVVPDATLNLALNEGIWCPEACAEVMARFTGREALRGYSSANNDDLLEAISEADNVPRDCILIGQGSGPLLAKGIRHIAATAIKRSPTRAVRWLLGRKPYPVYTGEFAYFKALRNIVKAGLRLHTLRNGSEQDWRLRLSDVEATLANEPGLVYVNNPSNPTGNLMLGRDEIVHLLERYPESAVWVDEAYVEFMDPAAYQPMGDLVGRYDNLYVSRTFSFAYGLAAARVGYLLGPKPAIRALDAKNTRYHIGALPEALAVAALRDERHLPELRAHVAAATALVRHALDVPGVEAYPTHTHYVFGRFTDGRTGRWLHDRMLERNIRIRQFEPVHGRRLDPYFRINVGTPDETALAAAHLTDILT